jgi:hypothetical protein
MFACLSVGLPISNFDVVKQMADLGAATSSSSSSPPPGDKNSPLPLDGREGGFFRGVAAALRGAAPTIRTG